MKTRLVLLGAAVSTFSALAESLPYISTHPQSTVAAPGSNVTFTVVSTNATAYQWRFNGTDLVWGTASSLVVTNTQTNSSGYYLAIAKNEIGWRPSQLAHLSVVTPGQGGVVPFSNLGNSNEPALYSTTGGGSSLPITNGTARVVAGPQLDQMFPVGDPSFDTRPVVNGFFSSSGKRVPNVAPGQLVWFRVDITYPIPFGGMVTQQSTTITQIAGAGGYSTTAPNSIGFPTHPEWPEPRIHDFPCSPGESYPLSTNQSLSPGESPRIVQCPASSFDFIPGIMRVQWRKDGVPIPWATNRNLTITNFQTADVGVYDSQAFLDSLGGAAQGKKYYLGIQTANGGGRFRFARQSGPDFVSDFDGIAQRRYVIQSSTNLETWTDLQTLTLTNGVGNLTNSSGSDWQRYYRAVLLP